MLFADLADSTAMTESMDPEDSDELLSRIFNRFEETVIEHEGSVEKYIGDAMVAVFGVPTIHEDDADRAIDTALLILHQVEQMRARSDVPEMLSMRIGIHSGLITTGRRGDFSVVTGSTMNIASRIQERADRDDLLISGDTAELCSRDIHLDHGRRVKLKGLEQSIRIHRVLPGPPELTSESVFVGRKNLLKELQRNYYQVHSNENRGFILIGEAGIGKTELVHQLIQYIRHKHHRSNPILISRARRFRRVPFIVIVDFISNYFDLNRRMSTEEISKSILRQNPGDLSMEQARNFASFYVDTSGQTLRDQAFGILKDVILAILTSANDINQCLLFIDNADSIDRRSRDFLKHLFSLGAEGPMLILSIREHVDTLSDLSRGLQTAELSTLSSDESLELIQGLMPALNSETATRIAKLSRGNPLYIRNYIRFMAEQPDNEHKAVLEDRVSTDDLPENLQNLIFSRIERFNPEIREFIIKLSVFLNNFTEHDARLLQERTNSDPELVVPALSFFMQEDLIAEERGMYFFRHDLVRKALYGTILRFNKKIIHRVVVDMMRELEQPHPVRLMHHLVRSGMDEEALKHLAGSTGRNFNPDFIPYLDELRNRQSEEPAILLDILFMRARILFNNGFVDEAQKAVSNMLEHSRISGNQLYAGVAFYILSAYEIKAGNNEKGIFTAHQAISSFEAAGEKAFSGQLGLMAPTLKQAVSATRSIMLQAELRRGNISAADRLSKEIENEMGSRYATIARVQISIESGAYQNAAETLKAFGNTMAGEKQDPGENQIEYILQSRFVPYLNYLTGEWNQLGTDSDEILGSELRDSVLIVQALGFKALSIWMNDQENAELDSLLERARFRAGQSPNDIDRVINFSFLTEILWVMSRDQEAEQAASEVLVQAQRYVLIPELFTLLVLLCEIYYSREDHNNCRRFLADARVIMGLPAMLRRRDRISCVYLCSILGCSTPMPFEESSILLRRELDELSPVHEFRQRVLSSRYFPEIVNHMLADQNDGPG